MPYFEDMIEVDVPVRVAYDQWTQFREYPQFMDGVESVSRVDATTLEWVGRIAGRRRRWRTRIVELMPDVRIAWEGIDGSGIDMTVLFRSLGLDRTVVTLRLDIEPHAAAPDGDPTVPAFSHEEVRRSLRRFKDLVEERLVPPGPWRTAFDRGRALNGAP